MSDQGHNAKLFEISAPAINVVLEDEEEVLQSLNPNP
jgi:hypothetical protein